MRKNKCFVFQRKRKQEEPENIKKKLKKMKDNTNIFLLTFSF